MTALAIIAAIAAFSAGLGWTAPRLPRAGVAIAWIWTTVSVIAAERSLEGEAVLWRMAGLVVVLFLGMKAVVHATERRPLEPCRYLFFCLWPGMRPATFRDRGNPFRPGWRRLLLGGLACAAGGAALLAAAQFAGPGLAQNAALLAGLSLTVHFGMLGIAAAVWKIFGFPAYRLFANPLRLRGAGDFWSRRWNLGFVEMMSRAIERPLRRRYGRGAALAGVFLFSGALHEIAITVPAGAGYGGPLAYFALHGGLVAAERRFDPPIWLARPITFPALILPLPLLFPPAFIDGALKPIAGIAL